MLNFDKYGKAATALRFFEEFSKIPHGSGNVGAITDYIVDFAKARGLFYTRDSANNVLIRKSATPGYENRPTVIFQGHTDMVAVKTADTDIDMEKDGLDLYIDGDFLRARGTSLGGDDGVAIAYALAILDSDSIQHPEFEAIFTSDEETGLEGAAAMDCSSVKGRYLINIDSDCEGIFTVGCAGGIRVDACFPTKRSAYGAYAYKLKLDGLLGGHSGTEIGKGRLNAIKELNTAISQIPGARLVSFTGGTFDNVIPCSAEAVIRTEKEIDNSGAFSAEFIEARRQSEPNITFEIAELCDTATPLDESCNEKFISAINSTPTGVVAMSSDIPGLVETSLNLGTLQVTEDAVRVTYSIRSSKEKDKSELEGHITRILSSFGAEVSSRNGYPAWEYKRDSYLREHMCKVYRELYGKDAEVITIHAGLECGLFSNKIEGLECVSVGPDNYDIHTTEERLSLSSFERVYEYLTEVLKTI